MALTDIQVRTAKPTDKQYKLTDGSGMHLLVHPNGSKYWRLQSALELVDIRLLDHLVVVAEGIMSLAARWLGLITLAVVKLTFLLESAA